jgi:hypothetical protein
VPIDPRTNLTTRALATLFHTSPSTVDRIIDHLVPILARALQPNPDGHDRPWIVDRTLIPVRDQSISAISKNYRRSVNTQIIIGARQRRVLVAGQCWPGTRNDVIDARATFAHLLSTGREILGDGGHRGITVITTATRKDRPDHPRPPLPGAPPDQGPRRTRHRPTQGLANTAPKPPPRPHQQHCPRLSPDAGTSEPTSNYGSTLSARPNRGIAQGAGHCGRGVR